MTITYTYTPSDTPHEIHSDGPLAGVDTYGYYAQVKFFDEAGVLQTRYLPPFAWQIASPVVTYTPTEEPGPDWGYVILNSNESAQKAFNDYCRNLEYFEYGKAWEDDADEESMPLDGNEYYGRVLRSRIFSLRLMPAIYPPA